MSTIILEQPGRLRLADSAAPEPPGPGQAQVRVRRIGVCGTDIHAFYGRQPFFSYPRILGHEIGVEVVALGPGVSGLAPGDRCAVEPYLTCGECIACRSGRTNCCAQLQCLGVHTDGGMRPFLTLPAAKLHPSSSLSFEQLALVEPLCIGGHAVQRAQLAAGEWVLVIGAGPIGLSAMQFAHLAGAQVIALDVDQRRLDISRSLGVADHTIVAGDEALAQVAALTNDVLPTAVFDATGNARSMGQALNYVAPTGRLIFVGLVQGEVAFDDPLFHRREVTLFASRNATADDFQRTIGYIEAGQIDTERWITHRTPIDAFAERFDVWLQPGSGLLKGILVLD